MIPEVDERYADLMEASQVLAIHPMSARRLIKQGKLPARLWQGKYLIDRAVLAQFKSNYTPTPTRNNFRRLV